MIRRFLQLSHLPWCPRLEGWKKASVHWFGTPRLVMASATAKVLMEGEFQGLLFAPPGFILYSLKIWLNSDFLRNLVNGWKHKISGVLVIHCSGTKKEWSCLFSYFLECSSFGIKVFTGWGDQCKEELGRLHFKLTVVVVLRDSIYICSDLKGLCFTVIILWDEPKQNGSSVENLPDMQKTWVWSLGWEDPLQKEMATHSSILAWRIPRTEGPGGLQSMGSQRLGHDWVTNTFTFKADCLLRWQKLGGHT